MHQQQNNLEQSEQEDDNYWEAIDADPNAQHDSPTGTITDRTKPLNNFKEYGFTADFEGEILKEIDGYYIGYINIFKKHPAVWNKKGTEKFIKQIKYNLTPIKKEWYEDDSHPKSKPVAIAILKNDMNVDHINVLFKHDFNVNSLLKEAQNKPNGWRLATKEETEQLHHEG